MRSSLLFVCLATALTHAETARPVEVAGAPEIAAAPITGIDPDLAERLVNAEAVVRDERAPVAVLDSTIDRVLIVFESDDPFSVAQRERVLDRTVAVLGAGGARSRAAGELEIAARAFDARWLLTGGKTRDAEYAATLVAWAERKQASSKNEALYLVRRARQVDPTNGAAADLDDELSSNPRAWSGRLVVVAGILAFAGGLVADSQDQTKLAYGLYIAAPILTTSGLLFAMSGRATAEPVSPRALPALR